MKYKVIGIYKSEELVDTETGYYKLWRESWRGRDYKTEEEAIVNYARQNLDYQIINDDGHGTLSSASLDWTIELDPSPLVK